MWCPEGYITLNEISDVLDGLADDYWSLREFRISDQYMCNERDLLDDGIEEDLWDDFFQLANLRCSPNELELVISESSVFHAWAVGACLAATHPFLCSPDGRIMRVCYDIFSHMAEIDLLEWDLHLRNPAVHHEIYLLARGTQDRVPFHGMRFPGFDYPQGVISNPTEWTDLAWRALGKPAIASIHKQFAGWAICFKDGDVPEEPEAMQKLLGFSLDQLAGQGKKADPTRFTFDCLLRAYPQGKNENWAAVQAKTGYSRRSINRALAKYDPQGTWARGGQIA